MPGFNNYIDKFDFATENHERYYITFSQKSGTYILTYSEYDNSVYYCDLLSIWTTESSEPIKIMKYCLSTAKLSVFCRFKREAVGLFDQLKACGDNLYYLNNLNDKIVIYKFKL